MISHSTLSESLQGEVLKTVAYILNRVPTEATTKMFYKLWMDKKPSLKHLYIWGRLAEVTPYRSNEKKLDLRTVNCHFVRI